MTKLEVLRSLKFGNQIAEEEREDLKRYFVKTDSWNRVFRGEVDVIYGAKGSGKSAIFLLIQEHEGELFDRNVLVVNCENVRGATVFSDVRVSPPTTEREFIQIWKLYFLLLIAAQISEYGLKGRSAVELLQKLGDAKLLPARGVSLASVLRSAREYISRFFSPEALETTMHMSDTTGGITGISGRIIFRSPSLEERNKGLTSVDDLYGLADQALGDGGWAVWLLLDRLDVAFDESPELEKNALRALFRAYRDISATNNIKLKIFLRTDIWEQITDEGFREATHLSRDIKLSWDKPSLKDLINQRLVHNRSVVDLFPAAAEDGRRADLFSLVFPDQVERGENQSSTMDWIFKRTSDGTGRSAPREVIVLLNNLRDEQIGRLERGEAEPPGDALFDRTTFKAALPTLSEYRVTRGLYAEYPKLRPYVERLKREKCEHNVRSLMRIWREPEDKVTSIVNELLQAGFFERRGKGESATYWVPFMFRPHLNLVQGRADELGGGGEAVGNDEQEGEPATQ